MTGEPLVSIGLPVFNGERYLTEMIESLLAQTYTNLEIVISDNASDDRTSDIVADFAARDSRIVPYRSAQNMGAAWNYNTVVERARGDLFKWVADDDVCHPDFVGECVLALQQDASAVLAYPLGIDIDEDGQFLARYENPEFATEETARLRARSALRPRDRCWEVFGVARRDVLLTTTLIGAFSDSDRTLLFELALRGRFVRVPRELLLHREHPNRSMRKYPNARARIAWFNPRASGRQTFPSWRLLHSYVAAILSSDMSNYDKLKTLGYLGPWLWNRRYSLGREAIRPVFAPILSAFRNNHGRHEHRNRR